MIYLAKSKDTKKTYKKPLKEKKSISSNITNNEKLYIFKQY